MILRILYGVLFFALVAAFVHWKRPLLWVKLMALFGKKPKVETKMEAKRAAPHMGINEPPPDSNLP